MPFKWINLFPLANPQSFVYFEAYVNTETNRAVGWITRTGLIEPYQYDIHFLNGATRIDGQRGSVQHARWGIQGMAQNSQSRGIPLEILSKHVASLHN